MPYDLAIERCNWVYCGFLVSNFHLRHQIEAIGDSECSCIMSSPLTLNVYLWTLALYLNVGPIAAILVYILHVFREGGIRASRPENIQLSA